MKSRSNCKGQSIIELTLLTPVLLVALYVPFDFGMSIFAGHWTQNAVRDGARIAAATDNINGAVATAVADQVFANLPNLLIEPNKDVTVSYFAGGTANCAQFVEVIARGTYNFSLYRFISLLGVTPPNAMLITRTTRMRYEYQPDQNGGNGVTADFCNNPTPTASGTHT